MLLAIDTSTRFAGVALADDERVVSCRTWYSRVNHTSELMPAVAQVLGDRGLTAGDLQGIAVALGPGAFSALRVGLSVAKGLASSSSLPIVGLKTLELEAQPYLGTGPAVCAMVDAGRGEVATALFGPGGEPRGGERICPPDELLDSFDSTAGDPTAGDPTAGFTLFCGEGVVPWAALIRERLGPRALVLDSPNPVTRLWSLASLGRERLESGDTDDPAELQPNYLRMPTIGEAKRRDRRPQRQ